MTTYEFGIMTTKYSLEAPDDTIAKLAMVAFYKTTAPIVIYAPIKETIWPDQFIMEYFNSHEDLTDEVGKSIREARDTIKNMMEQGGEGL